MDDMERICNVPVLWYRVLCFIVGVLVTVCAAQCSRIRQLERAVPEAGMERQR